MSAPKLSNAYHYGRLIAIAEWALKLPPGRLVNNCLNAPGELSSRFKHIVAVPHLNERATSAAAEMTDWPTHLTTAEQGDALSGYHAERASFRSV